MSFSLLLACLGVSVSLYGVFTYLRGILKDGTQPRMASWVAWFTANTVFAVVAFADGAYLAAGINAISSITNAAIIGASLKQRVNPRPGDWIDWACLTSSILCVAVTVFSPAKELGTITAMLANVIATIPTIRHAWAKPQEETWQMFAASAGAGGLGLVGVIMVSGVDFVSIAGPLMTCLGNTGLVLLTVGRSWFTRVEEGIIKDIQTVESSLAQPIREGEEI